MTMMRFFMVATALSMALPLRVSADLFTVNSTADPALGDPLNCTAGAPACTLRDALAAADATPQPDSIAFSVSGTIYLGQALVATQPVTIDGGGNTVVRVAQGYSIAVLEDRPVFGSGPVPVLQPAYYSENAAVRAMLNLLGPGSAVSGLSLDGSITPDPADLGVARIDFDSNGTTFTRPATPPSAVTTSAT
jgi:CSLREA domain-containing protein